MKIIETMLCGKFNQQRCEDSLFVSDDFVAVVDGVSSKTDFRFEGKTSGKLASEFVVETLKTLPREAELSELLNAINPVSYTHLFGWSSIIYLAALTGINPELYEAATVDGATKLQQILHVSIPCILPTIVVIFVMNIGTLMSVGYEKLILLYLSLIHIYLRQDRLSRYPSAVRVHKRVQFACG